MFCLAFNLASSAVITIAANPDVAIGPYYLVAFHMTFVLLPSPMPECDLIKLYCCLHWFISARPTELIPFNAGHDVTLTRSPFSLEVRNPCLNDSSSPISNERLLHAPF